MASNSNEEEEDGVVEQLLALSGKLELKSELSQPLWLVVGSDSLKLSCDNMTLVVARDTAVGDLSCSIKDAATLSLLATGELLPQVALATGKLKVTGDISQLRALQPILEGLQPKTALRVKSFQRRDGVVYYLVQSSIGKERRFSEFRQLLLALKARGVKGRRFPSRLGSASAARRRELLEAWLQSIQQQVKKDERSRRLLSAFCGTLLKRDESALKEEVVFLRRRMEEPEAVFCKVAAAATHRVAWIIANCVCLACVLLTAWLAPWPASLGGALLIWLFLAHCGIRLHLRRLICASCCMLSWKLAKTMRMLNQEDSGLFGEQERPLLERLALRYAGEMVAALAITEKGLLVKLGQVFASMSGVLAPELVEPLTKLVDSLPPMAHRERSRLLKALPHQARSKLDKLRTDTVIAAASIAEVHKLEDVALKLQKPGLKKQFALELRSVRQIASLAALFEPSAPDLRKTIDQSYVVHMRELDFVAEASALDCARRVLAERGIDAVVPEALYDVTDKAALQKGALAMRWCQGSKMCKEERDALPHKALSQLATTLVDAYACIVLLGGLVNLDPHAGNVLLERVGEGCRPVLLDWGMHEFLSPPKRLGVCYILSAVVEQDAAKLQKALLDIGIESSFGADVDLQQMTFILRNSDARAGADAAALGAFSKQVEANIDKAASNAKKSGERLVKGAEVLAAFVRMLDLLHAYVAEIPVEVDFLGTYAKWAQVAIKEHEHQLKNANRPYTRPRPPTGPGRRRRTTR